MIVFSAPRRKIARFDMTPMIDVVFLLIIFFMYTSHFAQTAHTPIDLPEEEGEREQATPATLTLDVDAEGRYSIMGRSVEFNQIAARLNATIAETGAQPGEVDLLIRADRNVPAAYINRLASELSDSGIRAWKLGTAVPGGGGR